MTLKDQLDNIVTRLDYLTYKVDELKEWLDMQHKSLNELHVWTGEIEQKLNSILEPAEEYVLDMELEP